MPADLEYLRIIQANQLNKTLIDSSDIIAATYLNTPNGRLNIVSTPSPGHFLKVVDDSAAQWASSPSRNNLIIVKSLSDFPTPVAGIITLATGIEYEINGNVNIGTNQILVTAGAYIHGVTPANDIITYTGTSAAITRTIGGYYSIYNLTITAPNGSCFNLSNDTPSYCSIRDCLFVDSKAVGTISNMGFLSFRFNYMNNNVNGLTFTGSIDHIYVLFNSFIEFTGTYFLDFNAATISSIEITGNHFHNTTPITTYVRGGTTLTYGIYKDNNDHTGTTTETGFSSSDVNWQFSSNYNITDSRIIGAIYISSTAATTFSATSTWTKVLGTTSTNYLERFTSLVSNRLTFTGIRSFRAMLSASGSVTCGSNNQDINVGIAVNGSIIAASSIPVGMRVAGDAYPFSIQLSYSVAPNDYYEVFVQAISLTAPVTFLSLNFTIQ